MNEQETKIKLLKSLLIMIINSCGASTFRNLFVENNGKSADILENGNLSCAYFVSCILLIHGLIKKPHTTVNGTVEDMLEYGWVEIKRLKPGAIILWGPKDGADNRHQHLGFCYNKAFAISNSDYSGKPTTHHPTYGKSDQKPIRPIIKIFWHPKLDQK